MRLFKKTNIDFMGLRGKMYFLSTTIIVLGMISLFIKGLNYGIDFRAGKESCREKEWLPSRVAVDFRK